MVAHQSFSILRFKNEPGNENIEEKKTLVLCRILPETTGQKRVQEERLLIGDEMEEIVKVIQPNQGILCLLIKNIISKPLLVQLEESTQRLRKNSPPKNGNSIREDLATYHFGNVLYILLHMIFFSYC